MTISSFCATVSVLLVFALYVFRKVDKYGTVIDPTPEDMRFICTTMQDIINNALSAGKKKKK